MLYRTEIIKKYLVNVSAVMFVLVNQHISSMCTFQKKRRTAFTTDAGTKRGRIQITEKRTNF